MKIYPSAQWSHEQIGHGLAFTSLHFEHWTNFYTFLLKEYETSKPDRFTPEQLKEIRYLHAKGVSVMKLAKNYNCAFDTMKKYLAKKQAEAPKAEERAAQEMVMK